MHISKFVMSFSACADAKSGANHFIPLQIELHITLLIPSTTQKVDLLTGVSADGFLFSAF